MKKFASVLLAVLVAFSMFSFVVSAAGASLTISADKTAVSVGETVKVTVKLAENSGLGALTFDVKYDTTAFKAVGMSAVGFTGYQDEYNPDVAATVVTNPNHPNGARVVLAHPVAIQTVGTVTITFEAIAATEKADFTIAIEEAVDASYAPVTVTTGSTSVKVEAVETPTEPDTDPTEHEHTMSTWSETKAATCKEAGVKTSNCTVCGYEETEAIPATGKCSYKWVVTKEATATQYGEKQLTCTMCGDVKETQKLAVKQDTLTNPAIPNTDAIA